MFWNKILLEWEEPRFAQKYIAKQLRFKDYLSAFGKVAIKLAIGTYIIVWFLRWISPRRLISFFDFEIGNVAPQQIGIPQPMMEPTAAPVFERVHERVEAVVEAPVVERIVEPVVQKQEAIFDQKIDLA